ncbi:ethanolamine ammonia-lyase [Pelomyxa schiedti]|nr:ethanolamine ammonia-lyase [Pelomyxa schiedti]
MYFETGQGSSVSYGAHNGIDMATCEALAYGLARRYHPFMVNNVTGFIGPETHADNHQLIMSCLQDLFCGKVIGLPMGMAPCFTMHAGITREGQQMAAQLLASAGANYYMDVFLGCDRMLAYFDVSGHDDQTMREVHGLSPAPEFCLWAEKRGIFRRNEVGSRTQSGSYKLRTENLKEHAGPRPTNDIALAVRANEAWSRSVVHTELDLGILRDIKYRLLFTTAPNKSAHLSDPASGATLSAESRSSLSAENNDVQIIISDGLSAEAIHHNIPVLLPLLEKILKNSALTDDPLCTRKCSVGTHIVSRYGRVKLVEDVASIVKSRVTISLIGERPGGSLESSRSMSAYLALALPNGKFKYIVIANIYPNGGIEAPQASELITKAVFSLLRT